MAYCNVRTTGLPSGVAGELIVTRADIRMLRKCVGVVALAAWPVLASAQHRESPPTPWAVGGEVVFVEPVILTTFVGIAAARSVATSGPWALRGDASVSTQVSHERNTCFTACDTRTVALFASLAGTLTYGTAAYQRSGWAYGTLGAGGYMTRWQGGSLISAQQSTPSHTVSGSGPSGALVSVGLGVRLPVLDGSMRVEARLHNLFHYIDNSGSALSFMVKRCW